MVIVVCGVDVMAANDVNGLSWLCGNERGAEAPVVDQQVAAIAISASLLYRLDLMPVVACSCLTVSDCR